MNNQEETNTINQYSQKNLVNSLEDKEIAEELNSMNDSEDQSQELDEELTTYQQYELKDNEDIIIYATTKQRIDAYLSNGIFSINDEDKIFADQRFQSIVFFQLILFHELLLPFMW